MKTKIPAEKLEKFLDNPEKALWSISIPILIGMLVQTLYMIIDLVFIGLIGPDALAAVAYNLPLVFFALGMLFGLGSGITTVIAQYIGANNKENADNTAEHSVMLGIVLSGVISIAGLVWGQDLLRTLGVSLAMLPTAWSFFRILASGYVFMVMTIFFRSILAGEGETKIPMIIQSIGALLNLILDPILMFGLDMGVSGAALATILSQAVVCGIFVYFIFVKKHSYITFELHDFHFSGEIFWRIIKIGLPASFSMMIMSIGGGAFNWLITKFSPYAVAAYQVASRIDHVFLNVPIAISSGLITLVGMYYGANRMDLVRRITRYAMSRMVIIALAFSVVFYLFARPIIGIFSRDASILDYGTIYLSIIVIGYPFISLAMASERILQGLGFALPMLINTFLRVLLVSVALAYLFVLVLHKEIQWVWFAQVIAVMVGATVALTWLKVAMSKLQTTKTIETGSRLVSEMEM